MVGVFLSHDTLLLLEVSWESLGLALRAAKGGGGGSVQNRRKRKRDKLSLGTDWL